MAQPHNNAETKNMKIQNPPSVFKVNTVFVGKINKVEFKVLQIYDKGEKIYYDSGGYTVCSHPKVKIVETETGKVHIHSLDYLCHLMVDVKNENNESNNLSSKKRKLR